MSTVKVFSKFACFHHVEGVGNPYDRDYRRKDNAKKEIQEMDDVINTHGVHCPDRLFSLITWNHRSLRKS